MYLQSIFCSFFKVRLCRDEKRHLASIYSEISHQRAPRARAICASRYSLTPRDRSMSTYRRGRWPFMCIAHLSLIKQLYDPAGESSISASRPECHIVSHFCRICKTGFKDMLDTKCRIPWFEHLSIVVKGEEKYPMQRQMDSARAWMWSNRECKELHAVNCSWVDK